MQILTTSTVALATLGSDPQQMGGMKKKIKKQKVRSQAQSEQFEKDQAQVPRSMIFRRGNVGDAVKDLVQNMRLVMSPHSALKLRERKNNQLKDFINAANVLHVTHFMMFSQTALSVTLRICRVPRGPTLSFRLLSYTTMRAVALTQKKPHSQGVEYQYAPLVVLNGFSGPENHKKIMTATFQVRSPRYVAVLSTRPSVSVPFTSPSLPLA